uniref:Uncharacterized protein n=1 Tax=Oryza brachyantha TaxID=4533 RepID=J3L4U5_ORYBR
MERTTTKAALGPVVELHPRPVLVEAGALPTGGGGVAITWLPRDADEGREEVGSAAQREAAEQRLRHRPGQEGEEVAREDGGAEGRLQEAREEGPVGGEEEEEDSGREGEALEAGGSSHGRRLGLGPASGSVREVSVAASVGLPPRP